MVTSDLSKNRNWRRAINIAPLAELILSMRTGWREEEPIVVTKDKEIVSGHRRTLAYVLASQIDSNDLDEIITKLVQMSSTQVEVDACMICGEQLEITEEGCCAACGEYALDDDGQVVSEKIVSSQPDPNYFFNHYNELIANSNLEVPAIVREFTDGKEQTLFMLGANLMRQDDDPYDLALGVLEASKAGATLSDFRKLGMDQRAVAKNFVIAKSDERVARLHLAGRVSYEALSGISNLPAEVKAAFEQYVAERGSITTSSFDLSVRNVRTFSNPEVRLDDAPHISNISKMRRAVWDWHAKNNTTTEFVLSILNGKSSPAPVEVHAMAGTDCASCPLRNKMKALPKISGANYPCQGKGETFGCEYHSEMVFADFRVRDNEGVVQFGPYYFFETYELAETAYNSIREPEPTKRMDDEDARPIDTQRETITRFMALLSEVNGAGHPLATPCSSCGYHTSGSPVKSDPTCPPCSWAARRSNIELGLLTDGTYQIPVCRQYMPTAAFDQLVPNGIGELQPEIGRALCEQLLGLIEERRIPPLRWLVGVPATSSEKSVDWARKRLADEGGMLSPKQWYTLVEWLSFEASLYAKNEGLLRLPAGRLGNFKFQKL